MKNCWGKSLPALRADSSDAAVDSEVGLGLFCAAAQQIGTMNGAARPNNHLFPAFDYPGDSGRTLTARGSNVV